MKAVVFFHDKGNHFLDPLLKRGFRHVAAAVEDENGVWILFDAKAGCPEICALEPCSDLATFYRSKGYTVIETEQRGQSPRGPVVLANCVGMIKSVLAIRAPFHVTPYQLYKYLRRNP